MKTQTETPRFAHLQYSVLKQFNMSPAEYWYLDMVYYLSRDGWCYKSLENIANDMNMTKNGVVKLRDRLIEKGLVIKNRKGQVKSSVMYNKVYLTDSQPYNLVTNCTTKYNGAVQQSSTKNNNRITIEKGVGLKEKLQAANPTLYKKLYE
jgi:DNA-binding MarR family transcriptional regulator